MADLRLLVEILTKGDANLSRVGAQLKQADTQAQGLGKRLDTLFSPRNVAAGFIGGVAAAKVLDFFSDSINAASDLQETISATSVVLGQEAMPALEEWSSGAAEALGLSQRAALDAAQTFATFGKSAGLAGPELSDFSTDLTGLAADLASFKNTSPEEAITAIGAALRGESEPIRRYGVLLDDATLRQRALKLGIVQTTKQALTPQQRVLAAQAEIWAQTGDAQGDFERTSDGLAGSQKILAAQLENVSAEIGEKLLPLVLEFVHFVSDVAIPALQFLANDVIGPIADGITVLGQSFGDFLTDVGNVVDWFRGGVEALTALEGGTEKVIEKNAGLKGSIQEVEKRAASYRHEIVRVADTSEREWRRIAAEPVNMMSAQAGAIREAAFQQQVQYAKGLLDGQNEPKVQMEALAQIQEESMSKTTEVAYLMGQLTSDQLAAGLSSDRDTVRAQAEATRLAIVNRLSTLGVSAFNWGYGIAHELALGMAVGRGEVIQGAAQLGGAIRSQIGIESEPSDHSSPLYGITEWGANLVQTYVDGMRSMMSTGEQAGMALAAAVSPATASVMTGSGNTTISDAATLSASPGGIHTHIHIDYYGPQPDSDEELVEVLREAAPFIDGRLRLANG